MAYYGAGDYYRGDYYRGDNYGAGGLFSFAGKLIKGAIGGAAGFLTGGPAGAVRGAASGLGLMPISPTVSSIMTLPQPPVLEPGISGIVHRAVPGGKSGLGRLKKDGTFTDRRRPRMNALNPRALQRALRREAGFLKFARRVGHFAGIKGHFKLKRARKR